jgi:hypothetical protein
MAATAQVSIAAGATAVALSGAVGDDPYTAGSTVMLYNSGAVNVGLGGPGVTSANMFRALVVGATLVIDLAVGEQIWGLVPSGSTAGSVDVLRVN